MKLNKWRILLAAILGVVLMLGMAATADACTSVIVGKGISETGEVLFGHNEDNGGTLIMPIYRVPRMTHEPGTMIKFEPARCSIPQVEQTWSYIWSETRSTGSGASFSDGFINEWGVAIASDATNSRENSPEYTDGGIAYGIRRIVAERARTAREGVEIIGDLVHTYGYYASGRSYQVCDKDEGWVVHIARGKHFVAQRVPDNAVMVIPNRNIIQQVDLEDTENFIASPDLITYAIERGWYTPAVPGDYSDFNYAVVYSSGTYRPTDTRQRNGQSIILGREISPEEWLPFCVYPDRKIGIEDVKAVLAITQQSTTRESSVYQFREDPNFTVWWRATLCPRWGIFVPWYACITSVPEGYGWIDPLEGIATHFGGVPQSDVTYNPDRAWWAFQDLQNFVRNRWDVVEPDVRQAIDELENNWAARQFGIETAAKAQYKKDPAKAIRFLTNYTHEQAQKAWDAAKELLQQLQEKYE